MVTSNHVPSKTAYFVLPKEPKHGYDLLCSHPSCQNKGIRFVYCSYCDAPVAKRNFSTRHNHNGSQKKGQQQVDTDDEIYEGRCDYGDDETNIDHETKTTGNASG